ncbi:MAG: LysR family transcriptional regulator [Betaproteobacteria bacterium RIFCSPLOWO2_02_FULL_62_17]|nr:MAG: LysR family transcriptional regulator [Betaproteobacteria bacterium RIFCSPLOWO2_02_FULL_62_17]
MTLTELRYIVAVARERHFGRAAKACFVSQPTLSVAIRKLEDELGVALFERASGDIAPTAVGERVIEQAQRVLEQSQAIKEIARQGKDPLQGALRIGAIYTIAPYLLPGLVRLLHRRAPRMPLHLQETYTHRLRELLKQGDIDAAVLALPFEEPGFVIQPLYDEPFVLAVPRDHPWAARKSVKSSELQKETMVLLGTGHCFRDQVLDAVPGLNRAANAEGLRRTFEGSSLETIRQMVASGVGLTVLPSSSLPERVARDSLLRYIPFAAPVPDRRVVLVYRKSFPRKPAIEALRRAVLDCSLPGTRALPGVAAA